MISPRSLSSLENSFKQSLKATGRIEMLENGLFAFRFGNRDVTMSVVFNRRRSKLQVTLAEKTRESIFVIDFYTFAFYLNDDGKIRARFLRTIKSGRQLRNAYSDLAIMLENFLLANISDEYVDSVFISGHKTQVMFYWREPPKNLLPDGF